MLKILTSLKYLPLLLMLCGSLAAKSESPAAPKGYEDQVRPILENKCFGCHGEQKQKGKIRLDTLSSDMIKDRSAETWHDVRGVINLGEMPPDEEEDLTAEERKIVLDWLNATIEHAHKVHHSKGGQVVLRRLTRDQYQNTMRDLLGLDINHIQDIPQDPMSRDGLRNNGSSLQMTGEQMEHYINAARDALDKAIVTGPQPKMFHHTFKESSKVRMESGEIAGNRLGPKVRFIGRIKEDYPDEGPFEIRVKLKADLPEKKGPIPRLRVVVGYRPDTLLQEKTLAELDITKEGTHEYVFRGRLENFPLPVRGQGKYPGLLVNVMNVANEHAEVKTEKRKDEKGKDRNFRIEDPDLPYLVVESVEFKGPIYESWPPKHHQEILIDSKEKYSDNEAKQVAHILKNFLPKAWRKMVAPEEVEKLTSFFTMIRPDSPSFAEALRETLVLVLVSQDFLYLMEPESQEKRKLNSHELAVRLSYFLWNTLPDDGLRDLANQNKLTKPDALRQEVARMVKDPRADEFIRTFATQWLDVDAIDRIEIEPNIYGKPHPDLKENFRSETIHFFGEILRRNLSAENFIESDFQLVNQELADHYKIKGVYGGDFRKVKKSAERGGVLTHGSVLLGHSTGYDSSIIKRAVFVRKNLLNDPPPPPPPNVPPLDESDPKFSKLPIREQLGIHRADPACADCHRNIDPWGQMFEAYGATGLIREEIPRKHGKKVVARHPVDSTGKLPDGKELKNLDELKKYLLTERRQQFAQALTSKLLAYAMGRSLEFSDEPLVEEITKKSLKNGLRLQSLVESIVTNKAFLAK
ncbi:DUF1592 domain-containing protein [Akkermansiaceae bacterium]|nr:DUF1592 domain-containing protein [Akkermansiaceae bacterium]